MGAWVLFRMVFTLVPPALIVSLEAVQGEATAASMLLPPLPVAACCAGQVWGEVDLLDSSEVATVLLGER